METFFANDDLIQELITESKQLPISVAKFLSGAKRKRGRSDSQRQNVAQFPRGGVDQGDQWLVYVRMSVENTLDFSCGLQYLQHGNGTGFTLLRYNGKSHEHTNHLEGQPSFYDFHIHRATERYQNSSHANDHFAEITDRYADIHGAFTCMLLDCNVAGLGDSDKQTSLLK